MGTSFSDSSGSSDAWLRFVTERMPGVLWSVDRDLRFRLGTGGGLAALGLRPDELIGVSLYDYFQTEDERFPAIAAVRKALGGTRATFEMTWMNYTYQSTVEPLRNERGEVIACVGMSFDVTQRKGAEAELLREHAQWQRFLEHVPAMLYETAGTDEGPTVSVPFVSPRCREFVGASPAELLNDAMLLMDAIHPEDRYRYYETALVAMRDNTQFDFEFRCVARDGTERWVRAISNPDHLAGKYHWFGVLIDIGAQKQRELKLVEANRELSNHLHIHIREASQTNERLQRATHDRKEAESALRKQSQLMDGILSTMPVVAFRINGQAELDEAHGAGLRRFGPAAEFQRVFDAAMSQPAMRNAIAEALRGGHARFTMNGQIGDEPWDFDTFLTFDTSRGHGAIGFALDVTEQRAATRELEAAEQTLRSEERLLRELLNLHERDRRLLALDIHDGLVQDVVGAHLALEGLASQLERQEALDAQQLREARRLLRKAIDEGRRLISDLRPMIIDERGIIDAISYLIGEHQRRGGPEIAFHHDVHFQRLPPLLEGTIFRIAQEALNNVHRHSQARQARVEVLQQDGHVRLVVQDDGIGFETNKVPTDRFGLRGIKERARLFGGRASIRSVPGHGTEVLLEIPIELPAVE